MCVWIFCGVWVCGIVWGGYVGCEEDMVCVVCVGGCGGVEGEV